MKKAALRYSLNDKINNKKVIIINEIKMAQPKTKIFASVLDKLKVREKVLLMLGEIDSNVIRSARNIPQISIKRVSESNAYDILTHQELLITKAGWKALTERMKL
jgi:large subunit ribosomal protein L4